MAIPVSVTELTPRNIETFWLNVEESPDCWEWTGTLNEKGYPKYGIRGRNYKAHRISFAIEYGETTDLEIDHICENRKCVRPDHLEEVTTSENNRRRELRRTTCRSGLHPWFDGSWYRDGQGKRNCITCRDVKYMLRYIHEQMPEDQVP